MIPLYLAILFNPIDIRRQYPMEGMYKILSAITNPTGYTIFAAGRKGIIIKEDAIIMILK